MATQFPLFNVPSVQDAQLADQQQGVTQDMAMANMDPLKLPRFYQAQAARSLAGVANGYFGNESPAIKKAKIAQEVMKRTQASGIDYSTNPTGYMDNAIKHAMDLGDYDLAQKIVAQKTALAQGILEADKTKADTNKANSEAGKNDMEAGKAMAEASVVDYKAQSDRIRSLAYQVMANAQAAQASGNMAAANVSKVVGGYLKQYYELLPKLEAAQTNPAMRGMLPALKAQEKQLQDVIAMGQKQLSMNEKFQGYDPYQSPNATQPPPAEDGGVTDFGVQ